MALIIAPSFWVCMMFNLARQDFISNPSGANLRGFRMQWRLLGLQWTPSAAHSTPWQENSELLSEDYKVGARKKWGMSTLNWGWPERFCTSLKLLKTIEPSLAWSSGCVTNSSCTLWHSRHCSAPLRAADLASHGSVRAMPTQPCFTPMLGIG